MSDKRKIRYGGEELGIISIDRLYRMAKRGQIDHTAEFWSDRKSAWCPLAGIMEDIEPSRIAEIRQAGIKKVRILDSGTGEDCPACKALTNKLYPIDSIPVLPPSDCTCIPWCRSVIIAAE